MASFSASSIALIFIVLASAVVLSRSSSHVEHLFNELEHSLKILSNDYVNVAYQTYRDSKSAHGALRECVFYCDHAMYDANMASSSYNSPASRNETLVLLAACEEYLQRCETYLKNNRDEVSHNEGDAFDDILGYIKGPIATIDAVFGIVCNMTIAA